MNFLLFLLSIPYFRLKARVTPGQLIWARSFPEKMAPASAEFYRSHPDTVQIFHRIVSHRLRSPDTFDGQPVLATFIRDLRDITPVPLAVGQSEAEALIAAVQPLRHTDYFDVYTFFMDGVGVYLDIRFPDEDEPPSPDSHEASP